MCIRDSCEATWAISERKWMGWPYFAAARQRFGPTGVPSPHISAYDNDSATTSGPNRHAESAIRTTLESVPFPAGTKRSTEARRPYGAIQAGDAGLDMSLPRLASASTLPWASGNVRWRVCAMLLCATTINYIDRQVLGVLAPFLQEEIGWSEIEYSYIVTAFQAAYAIGLLCTGAI